LDASEQGFNVSDDGLLDGLGRFKLPDDVDELGKFVSVREDVLLLP
jgi:hypothetical protein